MSREESAMDGVHDLGGMQGFGRVEREDKEPVFHAPWEAEVLAMMRADAGRGLYNIDEFRHAIERMRPADYLAATYYEKWLDGIARLFVEKGVVTEAEMQARTAFFAARPRFAPGDPVITRDIHPRGHTRLPRYARGKRGVIHRLHGVHVFPDSNAHGLGEQPQPLYSVRFEARELWGDTAEPNQQVHLDCWESYLLPGRYANGQESSERR